MSSYFYFLCILFYGSIATYSLTWEPKINTGEKTASSTNGVGKTSFLHADDQMKVDLISTCTKTKSKWIKGLNVTLKLS
jgi:hypothetical protein